MSAILDKINAEFAAFNEKKKALTEQLRTEFPALFADYFAATDKIESFAWAQYTPYFNDGDACTFGVQIDYLDVNGENIESLDDEDDFFNEEVYKQVGGKYTPQPNPLYDPAAAKALEGIKAALQSIPTDFFKDLFGDHVQVTITKSGEVKVAKYSHD